MNTILVFLARVYAFCLAWKYVLPAWEAAMAATRAGYDEETRKQRTNEAIGLGMLEDLITEEITTIGGRAPTKWEVVKFTTIGALAGRTLAKAGWDRARVQRKVTQVEDSLSSKL